MLALKSYNSADQSLWPTLAQFVGPQNPITIFKRYASRSFVGRFCNHITKAGKSQYGSVLPSSQSMPTTQSSIPPNAPMGSRGMLMQAMRVNKQTVEKDLPPADKHPTQYTIEERSAIRAKTILKNTTKITKKGREIEHASTVQVGPKGNSVTPLGSETHSKQVNGKPTIPAPQSLGKANTNYTNSNFVISGPQDPLCTHHFELKEVLATTGSTAENDVHRALNYQKPEPKSNIPADENF